jgi:hypothetical protein
MTYWEEKPLTSAEESQRRGIRRQLLEEAADEQPGAHDRTAVHSYAKETLSQGTGLVLVRPARKNRGLDFTIEVLRLPGKPARWYPSLNALFADIEAKLDERPDLARPLFEAIDGVWRCRDVDEVVRVALDRGLGNYSPGSLPIDVLLKAWKWMFIEQDFTYWLYSGRVRPMNHIRRIYSAKAAAGVIKRRPRRP